MPLNQGARLEGALHRPPPEDELESMVGGSASPPTAAAFRQVYRDHFDFVWRYAAHRGVPAEARDDVVQEVFMVVYRRLGSFEGRSRMRTWIAGITINVVRTQRRRTQQPPTEPLSLELLSQSRSAAEVLELKQALGVANQALTEMTELQREAFILCELDGLSGVEIAELLDINVNTLRTRLRGARRVFEDFVARFSRRGRGGA